MDTAAFHKFTSGLYVVSATDGTTTGACVINTGLQLTSSPLQVQVVVNKENYTQGVIDRAGHFALALIDQRADMPYIGRFGFKTSAEVDKFDGIASERTDLGDPYTPECACAVISARVVGSVDCGTHMLYVGEVTDAKVLSDEPPLTYSYYHTQLKGKTPPKASSFVPEEETSKEGAPMAEEKETYTFRCTVCGYEVTVDTPELPEDFVCPVCGVGPDQFERVED